MDRLDDWSGISGNEVHGCNGIGMKKKILFPLPSISHKFTDIKKNIYKKTIEFYPPKHSLAAKANTAEAVFFSDEAAQGSIVFFLESLKPNVTVFDTDWAKNISLQISFVLFLPNDLFIVIIILPIHASLTSNRQDGVGI